MAIAITLPKEKLERVPELKPGDLRGRFTLHEVRFN
jgi:hypothetical protein